MKTRSMCLPAAVCALFLAAAAGAKEVRRPDAWVTAKVKVSLAAHKNVRALGTNVDTKDGIVTLNGEVETLAEKELAARYAREVTGVRGVNNLLMVRGEVGAPGETVRDKMGDAALTGRVKAALAANRATSALRTNVDTERGVVTLRGIARSAAERDLAEKLARDVPGVRSVDNQIDVR